MTLITSKVDKVAAGMVKDPIFLSITIPCSTNIVDIWAYTAAKTMPVAHMENIRIKIFNSSTCVTVHSLHGLDMSPVFLSSSDKTAALSRHFSSSVCCSFRLPSIAECSSGVSYRRSSSSGTSKFHLRSDATTTWHILVIGLPPGL
uniref:Uncharacterized protein n=1 Tax=Opuntia streptacantha TaxID=393608 RepID=A0A7C9E282_OPUST